MLCSSPGEDYSGLWDSFLPTLVSRSVPHASPSRADLTLKGAECPLHFKAVSIVKPEQNEK